MAGYTGILFYSKKLDDVVYILSNETYYTSNTMTYTYVVWIVESISAAETYMGDGWFTNIPELKAWGEDYNIRRNINNTEYIVNKLINELELVEIEMICKIDMVN